MITLIAHWEKGWLSNKTEFFMWKQLVYAYKVDRLIFIGKPDNNRVRAEWFATVKEAISNSQGELFVLNHKAENTKLNFEEVEDKIFLFGNAMVSNNNIRGQHIKIDTPKSVDMFAVNAAAIVLSWL